MKVSLAGIALENGRIFIARRLAGGDMGEKWEFPGGKAEDGESYEAGLAREFMEEFGVSVRVGELLGESSFVHKEQSRRLYAYRIYFLEENFTLTEHSEWRWVMPAEIKKLDFTPSDLSLLPYIEAICVAESAP
ncbi:MAG: (deoxy)nucleoside triphosphate pyrophosphohydrolase [Spirochaetaceae bacterium]|jgi:8-oxo-dGTP diphosphatase|nr:(deoxy)nucleoside triphosphate pyrophosphohydrolase [Spirochaetaceae bacterium]